MNTNTATPAHLLNAVRAGMLDLLVDAYAVLGMPLPPLLSADEFCGELESYTHAVQADGQGTYLPYPKSDERAALYADYVNAYRRAVRMDPRAAFPAKVAA